MFGAPDWITRWFVMVGRKADADAALAALIATHEKDAAVAIAIIYARRGDADQAFAWLDKAVTYQDQLLSTISFEPLLDPLHSDPRWLPLLRKLGNAPEQLSRIPFVVTLPDAAGASTPTKPEPPGARQPLVHAAAAPSSSPCPVVRYLEHNYCAGGRKP